MKKVWASSGESGEVAIPGEVEGRRGWSGGHGIGEEDADEVPAAVGGRDPEIEPTAVIDNGLGANDVASGETAHDHVVSPSGPPAAR